MSVQPFFTPVRMGWLVTRRSRIFSEYQLRQAKWSRERAPIAGPRIPDCDVRPLTCSWSSANSR
jgi:hypothetical protein